MRTTEAYRQNVLVPDAAAAADRRRSIRTYAADDIPETELRELLRLTGRAPSAFNVQPWRFVVVRNEDTKAKLAEAAHGQQQVLRAPATIVMYSDMQDALARMDEAVHPDMPEEKRNAAAQGFRSSFASKSEDERETWGAMQTNIALGYLLLLAESMGFGTSPMLGFDAGKVKTLLGLPSHVRIPAIVSIGYAAEDGFRPHRLSGETLVHFR